ncbi:trichohyalin-like [Oreochromis niloticus]|uniref:trichohyalin-like n=1 Tax=Oreochromis niloticus TaxID=8128 RepID=UPI000DF1E460|nr:trichohyalin-like [Oreochromis niloticus]
MAQTLTNFNKALQTSSVQMPNKVLADLKFRAQKELKFREEMNMSDILIQNHQHNANLRTLKTYEVLREQREQIRRKNNLKEVQKEIELKEQREEKPLVEHLGHENIGKAERKARFKSLHNSWEDAIRLKEERMQDKQRESREWGEAGRKADAILLAKHMEEAQKRREKYIELCQYNYERAKEKRALAELEKEMETQYLLKQRRQATENERRRRDMELELLKAARKNIPVLDRTEGEKHSVVLEKEGSDDFQPKPKEPLLQREKRVHFFLCQESSSSEQTTAKTEQVQLPTINKTNRRVSVAKDSPANDKKLIPHSVVSQKTRCAPIIKNQYKVDAPYAPRLLETWDINTNKNLIPPLPPLPIKPQKTRRAPIITN